MTPLLDTSLQLFQNFNPNIGTTCHSSRRVVAHLTWFHWRSLLCSPNPDHQHSYFPVLPPQHQRISPLAMVPCRVTQVYTNPWSCVWDGFGRATQMTLYLPALWSMFNWILSSHLLVLAPTPTGWPIAPMHYPYGVQQDKIGFLSQESPSGSEWLNIPGSLCVHRVYTLFHQLICSMLYCQLVLWVHTLHVFLTYVDILNASTST